MKKTDQALQSTRQVVSRAARDYAFRTLLFSSVSFIFNTIFALFNLITGILTQTGWLQALGGYYLGLGLLKGYVLYGHVPGLEKGESDERAKYSFSGMMLMVFSLMLWGIVSMIITRNNHLAFSLGRVVVLAGYALIQTGIALYNFIKSQKNNSYSVKSLRAINMAAALVSFLTLEASVFSMLQMPAYEAWISGSAGTLVCLIIFLYGFFIFKDNTRHPGTKDKKC